VGLACVDFKCRLTFGTPWCAASSHRILPVALSRHRTRQVWTELSSTDSTSPYCPVRSFCAAVLTAVVRKTRSPQTTGQEWPSPGMDVFQRTLRPVVTSHVAGGNWPSATPEAFRPRNEGQFLGVVTATGLSSSRSALGATSSVFSAGAW